MSFDKARLAVAIGKKGVTKKKIEQLTGTIIKIDSDSGNYNVEADPNWVPPKDSAQENDQAFDSPGIRVYNTSHILRAINFGFNPDKALKLLNSELVLEVIDLEQVTDHSDKKLKRLKGRIIGDNGKIRNSIEQYSGCILSIYTKYVSLIGDFDAIKTAKKAINMILQGNSHKSVLDYLQRKFNEKKQQDFVKIWKPTI